MGSDKVPVLDEKSNYSDWKRRVQWWKKVTTVKPEAGAAALIMHMSGKPEAVAIQLDVEELSKAGGIDVLIAELDKLYEKDQTQSVFTSIDSFMNYRRPKEVPMEEYVREFNHRYKNLVQKRSTGGTTAVFEDGVLAYFLLHHANLSDHQKTLIRATVSKLSYANMESQLKRAYGEDYTNSSSSSSSASGGTYSIGKPKIKEEPVNTYYHQNINKSEHFDELSYPAASEPEFETEYEGDDQSNQEKDPQEVFYQQRHQQHSDFYSSKRPFRPRTFGQRPYSQRPFGQRSFGQRPFGQRPVFQGQSSGNVYQQAPFRSRQGAQEQQSGPLRCHICKETDHMMKDCKYNTFGGKKLAFFESDFQLEDKDECLTYLMGESTNRALLDTGASSTVCGKKWLTVFEESLTPAEHQEVKVTPCEKNFSFGDGDAVTAKIQKILPVTICGQEVTLSVFVVDNDIPLLLSRESMKKMKMKIDNETDKVYALGGEENLVITKSGHMMIPIGRCESSISQTALLDTTEQYLKFHVSTDSVKCAENLHKYFAHGSTSKIVQFLKTMQLPNEKEILKALRKVEGSCDFCKQHKSKEKPCVLKSSVDNQVKQRQEPTKVDNSSQTPTKCRQSGRTNHAAESKVCRVLEEKIASPWSLSEDESDQEEESETDSAGDLESVQDSESESDLEGEPEYHGTVSSVSGNVNQDSDLAREPEDHGTVSSVSVSVNQDSEREREPDDQRAESSVPGSVNQSDWESVCQTRTGVGVKKNDIIRFKSLESDEWNNALVIGRAGKPKGKNKDLYNVRLDESNGEPVSVELGNPVQVERLKSVMDVETDVKRE